MTVTNTATNTPSRARLFKPMATFGKFSAATTAAIGIWILFATPLFQRFDVRGLGFGLAALLLAALIATGWRWAPVLAILLGAALLVQDTPLWAFELTHKDMFAHYAWQILFYPLPILATCFGVIALSQNYFGAPKRAPLWLRPTLVSVAALCAGAVLATSLAQGAASAGADVGVSPAVLASLPTVTAQNIRFQPSTLTARAGETVAYRLVNRDTIEHTFTIDELSVNVLIPPGQTALALFRPTTPGVYTFYCAVPGHRDSGMHGVLTVTS